MNTKKLRYELVVKNIVEELVANGDFRKGAYSNSEGYDYGFVETDKGSIMYIQWNVFPWLGFDISYQYVPSRECGSGCQCLTRLPTVTKEDILKAEEYGINFVSIVGKGANRRVYTPKHYKGGFAEYFKNYICIKDMVFVGEDF